jgi:hypothetical protein
MKTLNPAVTRVLKRLHYPFDAILMCVRWYVASAEPASPGRNGGRARNCSRSFDRVLLGDQAVASTGEGVSPAQATRRKERANGRDLHPGQG